MGGSVMDSKIFNDLEALKIAITIEEREKNFTADLRKR